MMWRVWSPRATLIVWPRFPRATTTACGLATMRDLGLTWVARTPAQVGRERMEAVAKGLHGGEPGPGRLGPTVQEQDWRGGVGAGLIKAKREIVDSNIALAHGFAPS